MIAASCIMGQQAKAQSFLESILSGIASGNTSGSDALGAVLNGAVTSTTSNTKGSNVGNVLGNIISSVTGSATTTQANLVGTWSYNEPAVQFESKNLLTKAGGAAAATKVENKLASFYNLMGIRAGRVNFTFDKDGGVTYSLGGRSPFMANTHVEKRPLGTNIPETSASALRSTRNVYSQKSPTRATENTHKHIVTQEPAGKSGWLWTLIVIAVIAAGGGLGYLAYLLIFAH